VANTAGHVFLSLFWPFFGSSYSGLYTQLLLFALYIFRFVVSHLLEILYGSFSHIFYFDRMILAVLFEPYVMLLSGPSTLSFLANLFFLFVGDIMLFYFSCHFTHNIVLDLFMRALFTQLYSFPYV